MTEYAHMHDKHTTNILNNDIMLFPSKIWNIKGCPLLPLLFNVILEVQERQEKEMKDI